MKTNTTYPTKHPHWIDEPEYLDAIKKRKRVGHPSIRTGFLFPEKMAPERNSLMPSSSPGAAAPIEKKW
jgi:hypothetical protein